MIPQSGTARFFWILHLILLAAVWLIPLSVYSSLPDQIAMHFDWQGHPNRYASKHGWELWILPLVTTALGVFFAALLKIPQLYNYPGKDEVALIPLERRRPIYNVLREMMLAIAVCVDVILVGTMAMIINGGLSGAMAFPGAFVIVCFLLPLIPLIYYLPKLNRAIKAAQRPF